MWLLIECDDPVTGPGHDEKRRFVLPDDFNLTIADISNTFPVTLQFGSEMHPCTPGDAGYHCPICHRDIPPSKLQGRGCGEIVIDDNIDNLPKKND